MRLATRCVKALTRQRPIEDEEDYGIRLKRVLGLLDLTMLGIGSTLGLGAYVLPGAVAKSDAGPAVVVSFVVAAVASAFAAMCYAEFAARVPKAGSAYVYSYVTVGELAAFIIGWNLILEYIIGAASVARGLSNYIDSLLGKAMSKYLIENLPIGVSFLSPYPDFLTFAFVVIISVLVAWGVRESTFMNTVFTTVNLLTLVIVIATGSFYVNFDNWSVPKDKIPEKDDSGKPVAAGAGGFMPFGVSGIMAGAARCFYGYVGFDAVATTGEEAKKPKRDIPLALLFSVIVITVAYVSGASIVTLMLPYYLQDEDAPLPHVFDRADIIVVKYIVTGGAIFALCTNLVGCIFPVPRVLYAMGKDKLLFYAFSKLNARTRTPLLSILSAGSLAAITGSLFNLDQLIDMMSIGTLMAYTVVAICVLILRYKVPTTPVMKQTEDGTDEIRASQVTTASSLARGPNSSSEKRAFSALGVYLSMVLAVCITQVNMEDELVKGELLPAISLSVMMFIMVITVVVLWCQPRTRERHLTFKVPLLPLVPCISIFVNFYLMVKLDTHTWMRFIVWLIIGMMIYICYGIPNSVEGHKARLAQQQQQQQQENTELPEEQAGS